MTTEYAWLIERGEPPMWWGVDSTGWTDDPDKALRFERRDQAQTYIVGILADGTPVEHGFLVAEGAEAFDAAVQRAFEGSGVKVRTSFTPTEPEAAASSTTGTQIIEEVEWYDSERVTLGWAKRKAYREALADRTIYRSCGYLIGEDDQSVMLALSLNDRGKMVSEAIVIPKAVIARRRVIVPAASASEPEWIES